MPTYAYQCEECGTEFDAFASIAKKEAGWQPRCPKCSSARIRQIFKTAPVIARSAQPLPRGGCCSSR
ncbi:MAG: FmdB family zinc ribbon protein [Aggregatilineaceae bacterium]